jgi:putative addiction module component (TIGR02574 family)
MQLTQDEIGRLTPSERLALIAQLWDSLDDGQVPLSQSQRDELDRRLARVEEDRLHSVTWDALKTELARRAP